MADLESNVIKIDVRIKPKRKFFIQGWQWNVYTTQDKIRWDGFAGFHGWRPTKKSANAAVLRRVRLIAGIWPWTPR